MVSQTIKSTYTFDAQTKALLDDLTKLRCVSKSAALRRAIHEAAERAAPIAQEKLCALDETHVRTWCESIANERLASTRKRIG